MGFYTRYTICVVGAALFATSVGFTLPWRGVQAQKAEVADIKTCSGDEKAPTADEIYRGAAHQRRNQSPSRDWAVNIEEGRLAAPF